MSKSFHRSDVHKKKLAKNLAVLGMIAAFCAVIWAVTMIRIGAGS